MNCSGPDLLPDLLPEKLPEPSYQKNYQLPELPETFYERTFKFYFNYIIYKLFYIYY